MEAQRFESGSAAYLREALERFEADLLATVQRHASPHSQRIGAHLAAHAVIELAGAVCAAVVEAMPEAAADLDAKLGALRLHVAPAMNETRQ